MAVGECHLRLCEGGWKWEWLCDDYTTGTTVFVIELRSCIVSIRRADSIGSRFIYSITGFANGFRFSSHSLISKSINLCEFINLFISTRAIPSELIPKFWRISVIIMELFEYAEMCKIVSRNVFQKFFSLSWTRYSTMKIIF